ncbi:MAG: hypothetical protein R2819_12750 [Allomuricauda sp.]
MKYTFFILWACLLSCKAQKKEGSISGNSNDVVLIAHDAYSGITEYQALVIKDTKSLNKFYSQINRTRKPGLPVPMVDFTTEMVVVLCMGEQRGEWVPTLIKSEQTEDNILMTIELPYAEHKDKMDNLPVSYPFYLYKMPYSSKSIDFQKLGW